ncbi:UvrD-helicase domain-containing protein [Bacillus infantis]|uniref:UvrD-helicase domain-containing protein n=1 Tax=Bacillus infantis TaxID=324767 RepID=UPI0020A1EF5D|nr:UvrD-helicase domain-containing protein [Bacillus infantis]MCP1157012.1 UvrD-helicase domain-containing protein [Bacillus infantis]
MAGLFVSTYMRKKKGSKAEEVVWNAIKKVFKGRDCLGYWNYPIFSPNYNGRKEPDILILDRLLGITIIEVKGITINNLEGIHGHQWVYQNFYTEEGNPYQQAENQMYSMVDWIREKDGLDNRLSQRILIALPYITKLEWEERGFSRLPSSPPILFKEDLVNYDSLIGKISATSLYRANSPLLEEEWFRLTKLIHGGKLPVDKEEEVGPKYSLLYIVSTEKKLLDSRRMFKPLLEKGIKVIVLSRFKRKDEWFPTEFYKKYEKARLFQYISSETDYELNEPIMIFDGDGVDKVFEKNWLNKFPDFNKGQYKAEHALTNSNLIISAGAGTGKTTVMIQRIMFLLAMVPGLSLKDIVMITFTRESSQEMKQRLKKELVLRQQVTNQPKYLEYAEELKEMKISTIHSFAKTLIQELGFVLGFGRNVQLRGYKIKRREIIEKILNEYVSGTTIDQLGLKAFRHYELVKIIETFWNEMESKGLSENQIAQLVWRDGAPIDQPYERLNDLFQYVFPRCEAEFNKVKTIDNAITLGDLVRKISEISLKNPEILKELSYPIKYLFVDEFQDSDDVQIRLVAQIHHVIKTNLFVVGDIKQSIYRFRGADYTSFSQLKVEVEKGSGEPFVEETLQINYRTSVSLLEKLDNYFNVWGKHGDLTYEKNDVLLGSNSSTFGMNEFRVKKYNKWADELKSKVLEEVENAQELIKNQTHESKKKRLALLVRTNNQAKRAFDWLEQHGVAAEMNVGGTFYNSEAVKDFYVLLSALLYPNDAKSVLNAFATPFFNADVLMDELVKYKGDNNQILAFLRENYSLHNEFEFYVEQLRTKPVFAVIRKFLTGEVFQTLYSKKLALIEDEPTEKEKAKVKFEVQKYQTNLNHLMNILHQQFNSTNATLYALQTWLGINIKTNREEDEPLVEIINTDEVVEIVTVHKSKGLEYHTVIMPFTDQPFHYEWDEILFDDKKQKVGWFLEKLKLENDFYVRMNEEETKEIVKEETRLLYVAMTRTRERLVIIQPDKPIEETWSMQLDIVR